MKTLLI